MSFAQSGFDRRRINGPEESFRPFYGPDDLPSGTWSLGSRRKDRSATDIRPIFLQPALLNQANGSAYIETEHTKIACAVYGPRQSQNTSYSERGRINIEVKFAPFACTRRRVPIRDAEDRSIAVAIHQALVASVRLELLPKTTVDIFVNIIEADGLESCIASGTIAASTALADAGIEMFGLVTACSAAVIDGEVWLDPNEQESAVSSGVVVLASMPALGFVTSVSQNGRLKAKEVVECSKACKERCTEIHSVVAQALLEYSKF